MGKKKNRKNKRKKYNKSQFIEIVCQHCGICPKLWGPTFCYDLYKRDPETFINKCYMELLRFRLLFDKDNLELKPPNMAGFKKIFCYSGICGTSRWDCPQEAFCFSNFMEQIGSEDKNILIQPGFHGRKNKKEREVFVAYPTFFHSDNKEFKSKIEEILDDGN